MLAFIYGTKTIVGKQLFWIAKSANYLESSKDNRIRFIAFSCWIYVCSFPRNKLWFGKFFVISIFILNTIYFLDVNFYCVWIETWLPYLPYPWISSIWSEGKLLTQRISLNKSFKVCQCVDISFGTVDEVFKKCGHVLFHLIDPCGQKLPTVLFFCSIVYL